MVVITLRFPAGRFHSTPWGRHVNEGAPEWPPSPWRLLRSLVAAWKTKRPNLPEDQVRPVLEALSIAPEFGLPSATLGHTRHYMRWYKKGPEDQTLVFDAFVCVERQSEVIACWPEVSLSSSQRTLLSSLLDGLGYLGRAESWCEARLVDEAPQLDALNCRPLVDQRPVESSEEMTRVLCADPATAFSDEHVRPITGRGRSAKNLRPPYDPAWHLAIETGQLHTERWSDPPGSRWLTYVRPADCFHPKTVATRRKIDRPAMQIARYALDSAVLPLSTEALPIAEQARAYLMGIYGRIVERRTGTKGRSEVFSGKCADGHPREGHSHAFYLPTDEDGDGRLDHLTVIAEAGFDADELRALDQLRRLWRPKEAPGVNLLLLALGRCDQLSAGPLAEARTWVPSTPFLVTRHPKKNGARRDAPELLANRRLYVEQVLKEELARFVERRGFAWAAADIKVEPLIDGEETFRVLPELWANLATGPPRRPLEFKRFRTRKRDDDGGRRLSGTFRLTFPQRIQGPVCLGHSSHFGLGLFLPAREA